MTYVRMMSKEAPANTYPWTRCRINSWFTHQKHLSATNKYRYLLHSMQI